MTKKKKMGNGTSINKNRGMRAKFFDENAFFFLWFYMINLRHLEVKIYRNNQNIVNKKKRNSKHTKYKQSKYKKSKLSKWIRY